jgi:hypothetical protein
VSIPEGDVWTYELKLDGYRLLTVKTGGKVTLYARCGTGLTWRFKLVADALTTELCGDSYGVARERAVRPRDAEAWHPALANCR